MHKVRLVFLNGSLQREGSDYYWERDEIVDAPRKGSLISILVLPEGAQLTHTTQQEG